MLICNQDKFEKDGGGSVDRWRIFLCMNEIFEDIIEIRKLCQLVNTREMELVSVSEFLVSASSVTRWCQEEMQSRESDTPNTAQMYPAFLQC